MSSENRTTATPQKGSNGRILIAVFVVGVIASIFWLANADVPGETSPAIMPHESVRAGMEPKAPTAQPHADAGM